MPTPSRSRSRDSGDATPLVRSPGGGEPGVADGRADDGDGSSRVARLWEAIRRTRAELAARAAQASRVALLFDTRIRPRERAFTDAIRQLTENLVVHHERTPLPGTERALLGLWIDENLQSLAAHPFASPAATAELARRWRGGLDTVAHPTGKTAPTPGARAREGWSRERGTHGGATAAHPGARARDEPTGSEGLAPLDDPERIVSRLFRRLARVLHPDLEPDEARRAEKQRLMSECLRARDERDIDTLLHLYETHLGALPDDLAEGDASLLPRLLRRQLDELRARLRRVVDGDPLQRMILSRYAGDGAAGIERRVTAHATALDAETGRVDALRVDIGADSGQPEGLHRALLARRALAVDRLAIDELTGLAAT